MLAKLQTLLKNVGDLERTISRITKGATNSFSNKPRLTPKEVHTMALGIDTVPQIIEVLSQANTTNRETINTLISGLKPLTELVNKIKEALLVETSTTFGTGQIFKPKYNIELDQYIFAHQSARNWIEQYQNNERNATSIPSLKVCFNNVFGYYIEVTKTHTSKTPPHYERKQTTTNTERYTTTELKKFEEQILGAERRILELELQLFNDLLNAIVTNIPHIQANSQAIAVIDVLQSFADVSISNNYVRPHIDDSTTIDIKDGRHPVVETILGISEPYTPNSTYLNTNEQQIHLITGPNMAGKSCYLRQVALIIFMGQIGCFVPAKEATFGIVDRIFTRVGASDNISAGESTFMIEMSETAYILNNATERSLIILDEVGRGTAASDGISLA